MYIYSLAKYEKKEQKKQNFLKEHKTAQKQVPVNKTHFIIAAHRPTHTHFTGICPLLLLSPAASWNEGGNQPFDQPNIHNANPTQ